MVKEKKELKKDGFMKGVLFLMLAQVLIKLLGFVYRVYLTNKEGFGDAGNAIYSSGFQIYALLLTISSLGVPTAIAKIISEKVAAGNHRGADRILKVAFITFAIIGCIGTLALFFGAEYIATVWLKVPEAELTLKALSPSIFFVAIFSVFRGYFNGYEILSVTARSQTLEQLFKTVITVIVVEIVGITSGLNTALMAAGANLATTLSTILSFAYIYIFYTRYKKKIKKEEVVNNLKQDRMRSIIKSILLVSLPITISAVISTLTKNIDSFTVVRFLEKFMDYETAKAQYGILSGKVDTLITLPLSINVAFATALVPAVSAARIKNDMGVATKRISLSLLISMLIGLPCTIGLAIFAEPILLLLFPNAAKGFAILQVCAFTVIFTILTQTINASLQGMGKIAIPAIAGAVALIAKVILNIVLLQNPNIGILGAAYSSVVCNAIAFIVGYIVLRQTIKLDLSFNKFVFKPIIATVIMAICSYFILLVCKDRLLIGIRISTIIALISAVIIYAIAVVVLKIFTKEEMSMIPCGTKIYKILERLGIYKKI